MSKDKEVDDNFPWVFMRVVALVLVAIVGCAYGITMTDKHWINWCTDNGYAGYNQQTGELILYDKEYVEKSLKDKYPDLYYLLSPEPKP